MSTKIIKSEVEKLVGKELALSYEQFPAFHSPHEGYAVLLEEIEEAVEQLEIIQSYTPYLWEHIKLNFYDVEKYLDGMEWAAINAACEAIQVAAVCRKYRESLIDNMVEES